MEVFGWMCAGFIVLSALLLVAMHLLERRFPIPDGRRYHASADVLTPVAAGVIAHQGSHADLNEAAKTFLINQFQKHERRADVIADSVREIVAMSGGESAD